MKAMQNQRKAKLRLSESLTRRRSGGGVMEQPPCITVSQREQFLVENDVFQIYSHFDSSDFATQKFVAEIQRDKQLDYLMKGLKHLGPSFSSLDANRPWLCYWILHSIALLGESVDKELENDTMDFLGRCEDPDGGYGGGPGQLPHLATTYAAVNVLVTLGGDKTLSSINRDKMYNFIRRMKDSSGAFRMHERGEIDVRACYTAIAVASILNILDGDLTRAVGDYILSCQTYEGGIAGEPGSEAHGGYTFCGLAAMILINEVDRLDLASLTDWVVHRQGIELGFQGRTNKLVDGCYSFWQGATCALLQRLNTKHDVEVHGSSYIARVTDEDHCEHEHDGDDLEDSDDDDDDDESSEGEDQGFRGTSSYTFRRKEPLFESLGLQRYVLLCSQVPNGGFRDKPRKPRDFYHTCYCLSGMSVAQHAWSKDTDTPPLPQDIMGTYSNLLEPVHILYNVVMDRYHEAAEFFSIP
ncbi:PREDICTED: protein farnesyltransferase subunit beta isoform X2 [Tarenaya hassleriana]|uniref:protein farnesyltransferase subunit beta isoform X2 n=1 Tax=Tarenaya hassleriana TaxID=28532 RepID=UPI00053C0C21|nr:PREDICTED: protein farnesyltransferase subunit beta isoform X2 [Tarenaya hassleriana]